VSQGDRVLAYKFLARGALSPFQRVHWPRPDAGAWLDASGPDLLDAGVHACRMRDLPRWICDELWRVELAGEVVEAPFHLVAEHGRLVEEVTLWRDGGAAAFAEACAIRAAAAAARADVVRADRAAAMAAEADACRAAGSVATTAYVAAAVAELLAPGGRAEEAYGAERAWQSAWLARELDLDP
jgi:hypothetical protein